MYQIQKHIRFNDLYETQKTNKLYCMYVKLYQSKQVQDPKNSDLDLDIDLDLISLIQSSPRSIIFSETGPIQEPVRSGPRVGPVRSKCSPLLSTYISL